MGYTYYQKFDLAKLLKGKTIAEVKYADREGEHGFSFKFTDGTWLYIEIDPYEDEGDEMYRVTFEVDPKDYKKRKHCWLDMTGYWGRRRGDWRREDQEW